MPVSVQRKRKKDVTLRGCIEAKFGKKNAGKGIAI